MGIEVSKILTDVMGTINPDPKKDTISDTKPGIADDGEPEF